MNPPALSFRIDPEIKAALEKAAKDERRSISAQVTLILEQWLIERGYLKK